MCYETTAMIYTRGAGLQDNRKPRLYQGAALSPAERLVANCNRTGDFHRDLWRAEFLCIEMGKRRTEREDQELKFGHISFKCLLDI